MLAKMIVVCFANVLFFSAFGIYIYRTFFKKEEANDSVELQQDWPRDEENSLP
tara:strand:+ start:408 stop:566 length:159 start_codon:yes stop_codon:yes gene_type:complete